jgi:hypothetical protein
MYETGRLINGIIVTFCWILVVIGVLLLAKGFEGRWSSAAFLPSAVFLVLGFLGVLGCQICRAAFDAAEFAKLQMHAVAPDDPAAFSRQAVSPEFRITTDNIRIVAAELIAFANEIDADWRDADIVELRADRPIVPGAAPTPDHTPPPIVRF